VTQKNCSSCLSLKPHDDFDRRAASRDGLSYKCKACAAAYRASRGSAYQALRRAHYERNRERELAAALAYYRDNRDRQKAKHVEWVERNRDYCKAYRRRCAEDYNARTAKRRAALLQRTPAWLSRRDYDAMHAQYALAAKRTRETGVPHHVDHEIPLQGRRASGLHVPSNLRVVPARVNLSKGNKFDPEAASA